MTAPDVKPRETRKPDFPAVVHTYTDLLRELRDAPADVAELADRTQRVRSNLRRDVPKLRDAGVVEVAGDRLTLTAKGLRWVQGVDVAEGAAVAGDAGERPCWPIERIRPNPANRPVDPETIPGMADSIAERGLLQPLVLSPPDDRGIRTLWVGERRWRGLLMLADQHRTPPDLVGGAPFEEREATPAEALAITLTENVERQQLTPLEEAFLLRDLADAWGEGGKPLDGTRLAERLGRSRQLRQIQIKLKIAREASPEAVEAYRRDGSWDALVDSVQRGREAKPAAVPEQKAWSAYLWDLEHTQPPAAADLRHGEAQRPGCADLISAGTVVRTSYGSGPYRVVSVDPHEVYGVRTWSLSLRSIAEGKPLSGAADAWINEVVVEWEGDQPRFRKLFRANDDEIFVVERPDGTEAPAADDDQLTVNGVRFPNLARANEARRAAGLLPRPANHGVRSPATPAAQAWAGDLTRTQRLALIELAHAIGEQKLTGRAAADGIGDAEQDLTAHGAAVHQWWLDPDFNHLRAEGLIDLVQVAGGDPARACLTAKGVQLLRDLNVALPPSHSGLTSLQVQLGAGLPGFGKMATPWLNAPTTPPAVDGPSPIDGPPWDDAPARAAGDEWDRDDDAIARDLALLDEARALDPDADDEDGPRDLAGRVGFGGPFTVDDEGGIWCWTPNDEDARRELITVDIHREIPTELARSVSHLIAWALNRALDHAGPK